MSCRLFCYRYPPKLEVERVVTRLRGETDVERERCIKWGNLTASNFGHCLGFKLAVTETQINGLLLHENCEKLRRFGILKLAKHERPTPIAFKKIGPIHDELFKSALKDLPIRLGKYCDGSGLWAGTIVKFCLTHMIRYTGMLLMALIGQDTFSSYHAMKDKVIVDDGGPKDLTTMVQTYPPGHVEAVSWLQSLKTFFIGAEHSLISSLFPFVFLLIDAGKDACWAR
jgi:hypothetical protein